LEDRKKPNKPIKGLSNLVSASKTSQKDLR
jgi:hypothetical protein